MKVRRFFYRLCIILTVVCFAATIAAAIKEDMTCFALGAFETMSFLLFAIIFEPRPMVTKEDLKFDERCQLYGVIGLNLIVLMGAALVIWG